MDKSKSKNNARLKFYILAFRKYCIEHRYILKRIAIITITIQLFQILYILETEEYIKFLPLIKTIPLSKKEISSICVIVMFIYVTFNLITESVFGSEQYAEYYSLMRINDKKTDLLLDKTIDLCHRQINRLGPKIHSSHLNSIEVTYKNKILTLQHGLYNELLISKMRDIIDKKDIDVEPNNLCNMINFRGYLIRDIKKDINGGKKALEKIIWYYI